MKTLRCGVVPLGHCTPVATQCWRLRCARRPISVRAILSGSASGLASWLSKRFPSAEGSCVRWENEPIAKNPIRASRSFGNPLYHRAARRAGAVSYGPGSGKTTAARSSGKRTGVFLETNRFRDDRNIARPRPSPPIASDDTTALTGGGRPRCCE